MSKIKELMETLASTSPGEWFEDNDGFIATAEGPILENDEDTNNEFIILAKNSMPDILYALHILQQMVVEDQDGGDAFERFGFEARAVLRKLQVRI